MINTLNESQLHKTLKTYYAQQNQGSLTEVQEGQYIADIKTKDGNIIEIQTSNLSHLKEKIQYCIDNKIKIKVVYPLVTTKYIQTISNSTTISSKRKSPVHKNLYSIFKELTSINTFLLNAYFTLEVIEITMTEIRKATDIPVQSLNNRRRFKKNWIKQDKKLEEIGKSHIFDSKESYIKLFPPKLSEKFTVKELIQCYKQENIKIKVQDIRYMLWIYKNIDIIEHFDTVKKNYVYRLKL